MYFRDGALKDMEEVGLRSYFADKINPIYSLYCETQDEELKSELNKQLWDINSEYFEKVFTPLSMKRLQQTITEVGLVIATNLLAGRKCKNCSDFQGEQESTYATCHDPENVCSHWKEL